MGSASQVTVGNGVGIRVMVGFGIGIEIRERIGVGMGGETGQMESMLESEFQPELGSRLEWEYNLKKRSQSSTQESKLDEWSWNRTNGVGVEIGVQIRDEIGRLGVGVCILDRCCNQIMYI